MITPIRAHLKLSARSATRWLDCVNVYTSLVLNIIEIWEMCSCALLQATYKPGLLNFLTAAAKFSASMMVKEHSCSLLSYRNRTEQGLFFAFFL